MIRIKDYELEEYLRDPVLAAWEIMGAELDTFQSALLRLQWFVPRVIDLSGWSTSKSERMFISQNLRAILFPDRYVATYYQNIDVARSVFWGKYERYFDRSSLFADQFIIHRKKIGDTGDSSLLEKTLKNRSRIWCPAGDFARDAQNQASRRFNDLGIDEAAEIDLGSDGIDKQLLSRCTRETWNKSHRLYSNHVIMSGHAEDPLTHPFMKRVRQFRAMRAAGSTTHAVVTSCYQDYTGEFARKYRPDREVADAKRAVAAGVSSESEFEQRWGGIDAIGGKTWYSAKDINDLRDHHCQPQESRPAPTSSGDNDSDKEFAILGWDTAPGLRKGADWCAGVVYHGTLADSDNIVRLRDGRRVAPTYIDVESGLAAYIETPYAIVTRVRTAGHAALILHRLRTAFLLDLEVLDPGGGGAWVYKEMSKSRIMVDETPYEIQPTCILEHSGLYPAAHPMVAFFKRKSVLDNIFDDLYMRSDDGIVAGAHDHFQRAISQRSFVTPWDANQIQSTTLDTFTHGQRMALRALDSMRAEMKRIFVLEKDGEPMLTRNGFRQFKSKGKKDIAYAAMYGWCGVLHHLHRLAEFHSSGRSNAETDDMAFC